MFRVPQKAIFSNIKLPFRWMIPFICSPAFIIFMMAEISIIGLWIEDSIGISAFSRAGSIILLLSLFQVWLSLQYLQYKSHFDGLMSNVPIKANDWNLNEWLDYANRAWPTFSPKNNITIAYHYMEWSKKYRSEKPLLDKITWRLTSLQLLPVLIGTFIWGFGDLIANIIIHCGSYRCSN